MTAVMFLPRQFHVLVVQNPRERDVNSVSWSFPLYLLLINLFVLPIAFAGLLVFPEAGAEADGFILRLPLHFDSHLISVVVFLGGLLRGDGDDRGGLPRAVQDDHQRRDPAHAAAAALHRGHLLDHAVLHAARHARRASRSDSLWARMERGQLLLVEMGLLSFIAVAQCAPAILLGLYWRRGNRKGRGDGHLGGVLHSGSTR